LHFTVAPRQPKLIALDQQANDDLLPLGRAGKAARRAHQTCDPGAQRQGLALSLLGVARARLVLIRLELTCVRAPIVCRLPRHATPFSQAFEVQKDRILAAPQDAREDLPTALIKRVPEPPRRAFLASKRPPLLNFRFLSSWDHHVYLGRMQRVEKRLVH
jgi:hypothetical protein